MRRKFKVVVNGKEYVVEVEELTEGVELKSVASTTKSAPVVKRDITQPKPENVKGGITAPMPGKIVEIKVEIGDSVKRGQVVAILEAMKMENEIQAPHEGVVRDIKVKPGESVNRGDVLMIIE